MSKVKPTIPSTCKQCKQPFLSWAQNVKKGIGLFCGYRCAALGRVRPPKKPLEELFWSHVFKTESCWLWNNGKFKARYGTFRISNGVSVLAHRFSWELNKGPIPDGMKVLHNCPGGDNTACVNPDHLWIGTQQENISDMWKKGRQGSTILTPDDVIEIRSALEKGELQRIIAERFGTTQPNISLIGRKENWTDNLISLMTWNQSR